MWDFEITLDFLTLFEKNLKRPSCRAQKVRKNIQDHIGPCKSVGVINRPQRDQFLQSFVGVFLQGGAYFIPTMLMFLETMKDTISSAI